jgi:hypothetical protein
MLMVYKMVGSYTDKSCVIATEGSAGGTAIFEGGVRLLFPNHEAERGAGELVGFAQLIL